MMQGTKLLVVIAGAALAILLMFSVFTVDVREKAILFQLGEIIRSDFEPGLHFKVPFINNVRKFDARIHTLDSAPERFLTSEKKNVIVDAFVKWRITDVSPYFTRVGGDSRQAELRLDQVIKDGLRSEFGKRTINEVVSGERVQIMETITVNANREANRLGVEVVDVRVKRIDLPPNLSDSVHQRMKAERSRVANDFRSRGREAAERIRADADRQRTVILAEAYRDAELMRGDGDAKATELYANAFNQDKEFYTLSRSLNAYKTVFGQQGDFLVIDPDSEFFRYFQQDGLSASEASSGQP